MSVDASMSSMNTREKKVSFLEGEGVILHGEFLIPSTGAMTPNAASDLRER